MMIRITLSRKKIWYILLILNVLRTIVACPSECRCGSGQAQCRRLPATKLHELPRNTQILVLHNTDLRRLNEVSFASLLPNVVAIRLQRLELFHNDIENLMPSTFDGLPALQYLRIERNAINCDCNVHDIVKNFDQGRTRVHIICDKPQHLHGQNFNNLNERDLNCGKQMALAIVFDGDRWSVFAPVTFSYTKQRAKDLIFRHTGPTSDTLKLIGNGDSMFVCHAEEELNLDEFETDIDYDEGGEGAVALDIQNVAASFVGEHDCIFDQIPVGLNSERVKLMVTTEANAINQITSNSEFKAELIVGRATTDNHHVTENIYVNCPKTGKFICGNAEQPEKPKFISEPFDIEAYEGTTIELPCEGKGNPKPEIQWKKDGRSIAQNVNHRIGVSGSLFIKKITAQQAGRYECSLRNSFGRISAAALVTVKNRDTASPSEQVVRVAFADAAREVDTAINQTLTYLFDPNVKRHHGDLFKIVRYPRGNARELARASEIYERTLVNLRKRIDAGAHLQIDATDFNYNDMLTTEHLDLIAQLSGCMAHRITPNCSANMCFHLKYRSNDGTCNNFEHPMWGASLTGFRRLAKPIYENGFSTPIGWDRDRLYYGYPKPSPRLVSTEIISTKEITQDDEITHMVMQWGQFLDHDLDHAIPSVSSESWDGIDCKKTCENTAPCYPIQVPPNDPRVKNRRCIDLFRSSAICGSGMTSILFDTVQHREQINQLTAYIDASQVYGYSYEFARDLRSFDANDGLLRIGVNFPNQKSMLPFTAPTDGIDCRRDVEESKMNCFTAGDIRVNEQIGLTAMHTIWLREHNRIAAELKRINFHWDGETLYQEARKIVGAQMQKITYTDWLPIVLGEDGMKMLGPYPGYDPMVDAGISNEFATAALRFGHTLINPILHRLNASFQPIEQGHLELHRAFFAPWRLVYEGGVDPLMRGMYSVPAKLKKPTENLNTELTEKLFFNAHAVALDLAAINIQRGRDHGIPGYNEYRAKCNLTVAKTFDDLKHEISDAGVRAKLKKLYGHPSNIDLFVGGILEDQVKGGKIGPLFRCILIDQFDRLRRGDRHWYENPSTFRPEQLTQIKMASLGRVLCDNGDNITQITDNVFFLPKTQGGYKSCDRIPKINLNVWLHCDKCSAHPDPNTVYVDPTLPRQGQGGAAASSRTRRDLSAMTGDGGADTAGDTDQETENGDNTADWDELNDKLKQLQVKINELSKKIDEINKMSVLPAE